METGASLLLLADAAAPTLERLLKKMEFVALVSTEYPLAAAPRCRYASQREWGNRQPCG
jgi:hypothetical protein